MSLRNSYFVLALVSLALVSGADARAKPPSPERQLVAMERQSWQRACTGDACGAFRAGLIRVVGNYALLSWAEGDTSGEAVFERSNGQWQPLLHAGGIVEPEVAIAHGVPPAVARTLCR